MNTARLYDKLHRFSVNCLIGLSGVSIVIATYSFINAVRNPIKPLENTRRDRRST